MAIIYVVWDAFSGILSGAKKSFELPPKVAENFAHIPCILHATGLTKVKELVLPGILPVGGYGEVRMSQVSASLPSHPPSVLRSGER